MGMSLSTSIYTTPALLLTLPKKWIQTGTKALSLPLRNPLSIEESKRSQIICNVASTIFYNVWERDMCGIARSSGWSRHNIDGREIR